MEKSGVKFNESGENIMSEEKLDKIDRRLTELVTITGNLVSTVRDLVVKVEDNSEQIKANREEIKANRESTDANRESIKSLIEHQKLMSNQLADIARIVIDSSKKQGDFEHRISTIEEKIAA